MQLKVIDSYDDLAAAVAKKYLAVTTKDCSNKEAFGKTFQQLSLRIDMQTAGHNQKKIVKKNYYL